VRRRGARLPAPASVRFDSETSSSSTVIEVRAEDELGLVYKIASTLSGLGLNITFAKIATEKNHALDIFYVTDSGWDKLSPAQMPAVEQSLLNALAGRSNSMLMKEAV
jgi:[protein-PII] uridylyltransferase